MSEEKLFVKDIKEGQDVKSLFLVEEPRLANTKNNKPYVSLKFKDSSGRIEARVWNNADEFFEKLKDGDLAYVHGSGESYNGQIQLRVIRAEKREMAPEDLAMFVPASPHNSDLMMAELLAIVDSLTDPNIKGLLKDILEDDEIGSAFKIATAAKRFHHAYTSGLLEHTLSVAKLADMAANHYPQLNRDLLLAGAILHDLGKIREFDLGTSPDYTTEGRLLGHMILAIEIVQDKISKRPDFPKDLADLIKHLIVSHHGEYEMGSPKRPKIIEALALSALDDLDAKINGIGSFIENHADDQSGWTDYNRLMERFFYQPGNPANEPGMESGQDKKNESKEKKSDEKKTDDSQLSLL